MFTSSNLIFLKTRVHKGEKDELTWIDPVDDTKRRLELGLDSLQLNKCDFFNLMGD